MHCLIIAGAPASGKSTLAKHYVDNLSYTEINRDYIRFNVIHPGGDWSTYKFDKKNEKEVTRIWFQQLDSASFEMRNIVISDTLCDKNKRQNIVDYCRKLGYNVFVDILNPPLEELIRRDSLRGDFSVGADVVERMWRKLND